MTKFCLSPTQLFAVRDFFDTLPNTAPKNDDVLECDIDIFSKTVAYFDEIWYIGNTINKPY